MEKIIRLKVKKDLDPQQQLNVIKLKGTLISKGYTEIIHILDENEEFHINTFETLPFKRNELEKYINGFIIQEKLSEAVFFK